MNYHQSRFGKIIVAVFLFAAVFISHFLLLNGFGLYEDDYSFARFINADQNLIDALKNIYLDTARPVGRVIRYSLAYLGAEMGGGGLVSIYLIGCLILTLNTILTYFIIWNVSSSSTIAIVGALFFCLYPADTSRILLTHSLQNQPGMLFSLFGVFLYQKGRRVSPYILGFLSLLTYETTVLPLLSAPFLKQKIEKGIIKEALKHVAIIIGLILIVLAVRSYVGETRVSGLGTSDPMRLIGRILSAMAMGPGVSAAMFLYRPITGLQEGSTDAYLVMSLFFIVTFLFLGKHFHDKTEDMGKQKLLSAESSCKARQLFMSGLILWAISYMFAFSDDHYPPTDIQGRMTSVHTAATFAASLTLAGIVWFVFITLQFYDKSRTVFIALITLYFSLLAEFSYVVQKDFVRSWNYQKDFWRPIIALAPDMDKNSTIFYKSPPGYMKNTKYIQSHSWADVVVPDGFYNFGGTYKPRFYYFSNELIDSFRVKHDKIYYNQPQIGGGTIETEFNPENIIFLYVDAGGELKRFEGAAYANNVIFDIPTYSRPTPLAKTGLYKLIMQND